MKIALLSSTFFPAFGGAEVGLHNIALELHKKGHSVTLIGPYSSKKYTDNFSFPYHIIGMFPKYFSLFKYLPKYVCNMIYKKKYSRLQKKYKFDIWHITQVYPAGISFLPYYLTGEVNAIVRATGADINYSHEIGYGERRNQKVNNLLCSGILKFRKLISISDSVSKQYMKIGVERKNIFQIPNGIDIARFDSVTGDPKRIREKLNVNKASKIILCVGRNNPVKNLGILVTVQQRLKEKYNGNVVFIVAGKETHKLRDLLEPENSGNFITLPEYSNSLEDGQVKAPHTALIELYKSADLFLFPSYMETFGIVLIEAMACNLPVVTTDVPGCRDLIKHGKNGLLSAPDDVELMTDNVLRCLTDANLVTKFVNYNKRFVQNYNWKDIVNKYIDLYQN